MAHIVSAYSEKNKAILFFVSKNHALIGPNRSTDARHSGPFGTTNQYSIREHAARINLFEKLIR
jgi:hypothetical protein